MNESKIFHIINDLGPGGTQKYLANLINKDSKNTHFIYVIDSSKDNEHEINARKIFFSKFGKLGFPIFHIIEVNYLVIKFKFKIVNSWLYHSDLLSIFIIPFFGVKRIWSIRNSIVDRSFLKYSTRIIIRINSLFSNFIPNIIIYNSHAGMRSHEKYGFNKIKSDVILNGISFQAIERDIFFKKDGIFKIGTACRNDPVKGLDIMLKALNNLNFENWQWTLIGENAEKLCQNYFPNRIHLINHKSDLEEFYFSLDIFVLPSLSEGFSNVLLEAMSKGINCIATEVGDNNLILGENNIIIPPEDDKALSDALNKAYKTWMMSDKKSLNVDNINYVKKQFSFSKSLHSFQGVWKI